MNDKFFLDTNIFIYSVEGIGEKGLIADELIQQALVTGKGVISYQVIQECLNVIIRKAKVPANETMATRYFKTVLSPLCEIHSSLSLYSKAIEIKYRWQFSLYDALIISAALQTNCKILYSEDLQHLQQIEALTIINPFIL